MLVKRQQWASHVIQAQQASFAMQATAPTVHVNRTQTITHLAMYSHTINTIYLEAPVALLMCDGGVANPSIALAAGLIPSASSDTLITAPRRARVSIPSISSSLELWLLSLSSAGNVSENVILVLP